MGSRLLKLLKIGVFDSGLDQKLHLDNASDNIRLIVLFLMYKSDWSSMHFFAESVQYLVKELTR